MQTDTSDQFEGRLRAQTTAYLDQLEACVGQLPPVLSRYAANDDYEDAVERIVELESACDQTNRQLSALVSNATVGEYGVELSRLYLNSNQTIELFQRLDEIANAAEQFGLDIITTTPSRSSDCLDLLFAMANIAARTISTLRTTVKAYVRMLCEPEKSVSVIEEVQTVRTAETDCDEFRTDCIEAAFDADSTRSALVYRELALGLDSVVDTMEDVTDHMILSSNSRSWISLEPTGVATE